MSPRRQIQLFLDEIIRDGAESGNYSVVTTAISGDDIAVLLYHWGATGLIYGRIYRWIDLISIFDGVMASAESIASDVAVHDFDSPPGMGKKIGYEWTTHLGVPAGDVRWCDVSDDFSQIAPVVYRTPPLTHRRGSHRGV